MSTYKSAFSKFKLNIFWSKSYQVQEKKKAALQFNGDSFVIRLTHLSYFL